MIRNISRLLVPYLVLALMLIILVACQDQQAIQTPADPSSTLEPFPVVPSPSPTPIEMPLPAPTVTVDVERRPGPGITASAVMGDGSFWYAFDSFDGLGGSPPGSQNQGLYRLLAGQITHYDLPATIRVLAVAPDDALYIGAGCGVLRFQAERIETLLEFECNQPGQLAALFALAIAFGDDGLVWVGGAHNLASYDGQTWHEYGLPAFQIAIAPDGTIWTHGWDGRTGSNCCLYHLTADGPISYPWSAETPAPPEVLNQLFGLNTR